MRKFTRLVLTVDCLLVMSACFTILAWGVLSMERFRPHYLVTFVHAAVAALKDPPVRLGVELGALGVLLLHLFWLDWAVRARRRGNAIVVQKDDGTLIIAVSAVEDSLERALKQQSGVRDVRVRVRVSQDPGEPTDVVAVASILDGEGIHAVEERMRQAVRRRFQEILPQQALRVSVRLRRFVAGETPRQRREDVERVYRGPEYPVEGF